MRNRIIRRKDCETGEPLSTQQKTLRSSHVKSRVRTILITARLIQDRALLLPKTITKLLDFLSMTRKQKFVAMVPEVTFYSHNG